MGSESGGVLHLVRHGESLGNVNPALQRREDPPLTDLGRAQAARAAAALSRAGLHVVRSSPLRRARETAQAIATAAGVGVELIEGFAEVDMGALANPETPEARAERDAIFSAWLAGDRSRPFPGGEDFSAVVRRVRDGLRAIFGAAPCARVAIVTHRMPIAAATALCEPGGAPGTPGSCPNGSITTLLSKGGDRWRLLAWGDARHLA